jgi:hypothetical protein
MLELSGPFLKPINTGPRKMNKKIFFLLFTFYCLLFTKLVSAQRPTEDYFFQYEKYQGIYKQFTLARDKYLKYKALTAKDSAIEAAKSFILQRNQVLRTHFLALEDKLRNTSGIIDTQKEDGLIGQLDKKILWLEEQNEEVEKTSTPSLEDLFVLSDRIEDKEEEFKNLAYQSLAEVLLGKMRSLQGESVSITTLLKEQVSQNQSATHAAQLNLWLKEVSVKNYLSQKEIEAAEINLWKLRADKKTSGMIKKFTNIQIDIDDARIYLKQAVKFQKEIYSELNND